jgi:hypothetical protein
MPVWFPAIIAAVFINPFISSGPRDRQKMRETIFVPVIAIAMRGDSLETVAL